MVTSFVLTGGLLVDGTGAAARAADLRVDNGRISQIDRPGRLEAAEVIDVSGLVIAPGFVDIHSHADFTLVRDGRAQSSILQGVTSLATGNCGHGVAPLSAMSADLAPMNIFGWGADADVDQTWESFADYMGVLRDRGVAANVFPLVAHGALRLSVAGFSDRPLDRRETLELARQLEAAMVAGAAGMSTGLEYAPGLAASEAELITIAEGMKEFDALYATHCRNRSMAMAEAAAEAVHIAGAANARLQMSHFVKRPNAPEGPAKRSWEILDAASGAGMGVFADVFPFDYGPTPLAVLIPMRMRDCGRAEMAARLREPPYRAAVLSGLGGMFEAAVRDDRVRSMFVAADGADGASVGLSLAEVGERLNLNAVEAAYWLLENAGENFGCVAIVENWVVWSDLVAALEDNRFLIMGDGVTSSLDPASPTFSLSDWGYAPRFLSSFVRDGGARVSLEEAVHRMTLAPARQLGLTDRGSLEVGQAADIVAFDLDRLGVDVTPSSLRRKPTGIERVWVNGVEVVRDGSTTEARPGVVGLPR